MSDSVYHIEIRGWYKLLFKLQLLGKSKMRKYNERSSKNDERRASLQIEREMNLKDQKIEIRPC